MVDARVPARVYQLSINTVEVEVGESEKAEARGMISKRSSMKTVAKKSRELRPWPIGRSICATLVASGARMFPVG